MNYRLDCPHCGAPMAVSPAKAGDEVACSSCQQIVNVPRLGDLKRLPLIDADNPKTDKKNPDAISRGVDSPLAVITLGLIATAGLLVAGYAGLRWYLIDVELTTDEHVAIIQEGYAEYPAANLLLEYETMEEYGLELPMPASYIKTAEIRHQWGTTAVAAAVITALAAAGVFLLGRRRVA